jgi:hypothetical protein
MESDWVSAEIAKAPRREIEEDKAVLFPVRLCSFAEFAIPDFSDRTNPASYKT